MGFFSDLFGGGKKTDFGAIYKEPPQLRIDDAQVWLQQLDDLIREYDGIKTGTNTFDAVKYMYEPQAATINREYGIGVDPRDIFGAKNGALQRRQAEMNARGLLDTGTSAIIEAQLESNRARDLADLMGQAKQVQRAEYFDALNNLERLFPQRFEVRNINNINDFNNAMRSYNVGFQRDVATEADRLARAAAQQQQFAGIAGAFSPVAERYFNSRAQGMQNRANVFMGTNGGGGMDGVGGGNGPGGGIDLGNLFGRVAGWFREPNDSTIMSSEGRGVRNYGPAPVNRPGLNDRLMSNSAFGTQPTTAQQSSLINTNTPGFKNFFSGGPMGGGSDFSSLLIRAMMGGM